MVAADDWWPLTKGFNISDFRETPKNVGIGCMSRHENGLRRRVDKFIWNSLGSGR